MQVSDKVLDAMVALWYGSRSEVDRDAMRAALTVLPDSYPVAIVTECEACFTPDVCQLRGTCDHYSAERLRVASSAPAVLPVATDADLEPFAWATFDGEGGHDLRLYEGNEDYRDGYIARNGARYAGWVFPLYTRPVDAAQIRAEVIEECAKLCGEFAQSWWSIHCDSNKHMDTTRKAHEDFCRLQIAIRALRDKEPK